jgi:Flp pilus assembly protein TadB
MPAKPIPNGKQTAASFAERDGANVAAAGRQRERGLDSEPIPSANERLAAERTERRRQRAQAHSAPAPARKPPEAQQRKHAPDSKSALQRRARLTLRDSVSVTLIVVLVAGAVVGAILGALGAANWITGLLVAALALSLPPALRSFSRSA